MTPEEDITAIIKFVRFAEMRCITSMETLMTKHIKAIIIASSAPRSDKFEKWRVLDTDTHSLTSQHITSAVFLSDRHQICAILAVAAVKGFLQHKIHKFLRET